MEEIFQVVMAKNLQKLMINTKAQTQEVQKTLNKTNRREKNKNPIIFKLQNTKDKGKI